MVAIPSYSVEEAALELDADEELVRAAAARLGLERFRGVYAITPDELAAIREELGIASGLDDDEEVDSDDIDSDDIDSDDIDSDDIDSDDIDSDDIEDEIDDDEDWDD